MTATEILAEAAIALGHDAKKTEVAGMAQRGGVVSSHLRFGPKVLSPQIMAGTADLLVGFEAAEALRWCHYLKPGGLVLMNTARLVPPVVDLGLYDYPDDPLAEIRARGYPGACLRRHGHRAGTRRRAPGQHGDARRHGRPPALPAEVLLEAILKRFARASRTWSRSTARPSRPAGPPTRHRRITRSATA